MLVQKNINERDIKYFKIGHQSWGKMFSDFFFRRLLTLFLTFFIIIPCMWCVQGFGFPVCYFTLPYLLIPNSSSNPRILFGMHSVDSVIMCFVKFSAKILSSVSEIASQLVPENLVLKRS